MNVLIIEDESLNAEIIVDFLQRYDPTIRISGLLQSKEQTHIWVDENGQADLVFCDIELLDGNVFSLLKKNIITSPIIFTTAYNTFYQEAFDVNGIGYLLKPVSYERFCEAMKKFESLKSSSKNIDWHQMSQLIHQNSKTYKERLIIKNAGELYILNTEKTAAILSNAGKLSAIDDHGKSHEFRYKMADLAEELDPKIFFQINRGEFINIHYIEKIEPYIGDRLCITLRNHKTKLITSAATTPNFRKWLE